MTLGSRLRLTMAVPAGEVERKEALYQTLWQIGNLQRQQIDVTNCMLHNKNRTLGNIQGKGQRRCVSWLIYLLRSCSW
jgi:hypothetical protein